MKKILVATDGSKQADKAVSFAVDLAKKFEAKLIIVHVNEGHTLSSQERHLASVEYAEEINNRLGDKSIELADMNNDIPTAVMLNHNWATDNIIRDVLARGLLDQVREDVLAKDLKDVETVLVDGNVAKGILKTARDYDVDMIVLGSRGRNEFEELILGSVAHKVNHLSDRTVVTVK